tara:strand:+ start:361 stop:627 length:267 start_codon:yes stop_codon:yes gene_type:complete
MYYCDFDAAFGQSWRLIIYLPVGAMFVFYAMFVLQTTADEYLSPSLDFITTHFRIPQSLAGVTFLAFGNGAADLFTSLAATGSHTGQV